MNTRLHSACTLWRLSGPRRVAATPRALVYRVTQDDRPLARKLLTPEGVASEAAAPGLLRHWAKQGPARGTRQSAKQAATECPALSAVEVMAATTDALLLDWLPGPSLGDVARGGDDHGAAAALAEVAARLLAVEPAPDLSVPPGLRPLSHHLRALLTHPAPTANMATARDLAADMLATPGPERLLHGDLHHDNVLKDRAGTWRVIDPKGLRGEAAFDLANAFRNPVGLETLAANPARMRCLAEIFAARTGASATRLLCWAAVQAAVSLSWDAAEHQQSPDHAILATALSLTRDRDTALR